MDKEKKMNNEEWRAFIAKIINDAFDARMGGKKEILIPRKKTAKLLGKNVSTLYRWEKTGYLLPAVRRGRSVYYSTLDLKQFGIEL